MTTPDYSPVVQATGLTKWFDSHSGRLSLFSELELTIQRGESVAIIGPSGSGKSTLLSLLAGLDSPSHGDVMIAGQALAQLDDSQRAALRSQHLSFIFQAFHLLPELNALENVMLPLEIRGQQNAEATARQWLDNVGLAERHSHYPPMLSGGEQQRVAIARAFATEPTLLFADEPTGNLDQSTGDAIVEQLFTLNREYSTTLILITHDSRLAARCGRVLQLQQGQLVEQPAAGSAQADAAEEAHP
ncbi:MAG: ATP-binding cassette domain-containing protein [Marinobacterium sp.]|nr:ATP-binding cassette domain-containing protein [Marinobacterium sp.]